MFKKVVQWIKDKSGYSAQYMLWLRREGQVQASLNAIDFASHLIETESDRSPLTSMDLHTLQVHLQRAFLLSIPQDRVMAFWDWILYAEHRSLHTFYDDLIAGRDTYNHLVALACQQQEERYQKKRRNHRRIELTDLPPIV